MSLWAPAVGPSEGPKTRTWDKNPRFFIGKLSTDLDTCELGIMSGIAVRLEIVLQKPEFFLNCTAEVAKALKPKFVLSKMTVHARVGELTDELSIAFERRLSKEPAKYQFRRRCVTPFRIPGDGPCFLSDTIFPTHAIPTRVIIAFVDERAYLGNYSEQLELFWVYFLNL